MSNDSTCILKSKDGGFYHPLKSLIYTYAIMDADSLNFLKLFFKILLELGMSIRQPILSHFTSDV